MKRTLAILGGLLSLALPTTVLAQPYVPCAGLIGCGDTVSNVLFNVLPRVAAVLITIAAGSCMLLVIFNGARYLTTYGDDSVAEKAKKGIIYALGGLGVSLAAVPLVAAVATETPSGGPDIIVAIMATASRIILTFFNVLFVIAIMYGGFQMVLGRGSSDGYQKGLTSIKYAIIGAVIVNVARGIVDAFLSIAF